MSWAIRLGTHSYCSPTGVVGMTQRVASGVGPLVEGLLCAVIGVEKKLFF